MVEGRLAKWAEEVCLLQQRYLLDDSKKVAAVVAEAGRQLGLALQVKGFVRVQVSLLRGCGAGARGGGGGASGGGMWCAMCPALHVSRAVVVVVVRISPGPQAMAGRHGVICYSRCAGGRGAGEHRRGQRLCC